MAEGDARKASVLKGPAYRSRRRGIENARLGIQLLTLLVVVWIGAQFTLWVRALEAGRLSDARPPGVEGFLPISALLSLRHLVTTGEASRVHPAGLVVLLLAVLLALLLKKSFCSWICPVGFLSESLASFGARITGRKISLPRWLDLPLRGIKYLLLAFFVYAVFWQMSAREVQAFIDSPYNKVADVKMLLFFAAPTPLALKVLLALVALSTLVPYFWCRYLCPYGGLLGVVSLASPVKVTRTASQCIDCGLCARACPSNLAVDQARRVSSDECTACLSCVAACPVPSALGLETPGRRRLRPLAAALIVALLFYGGIQAAKLAGYWESEITAEEYMRRVQEIDSPKYYHARGRVPDYGPMD